MQILLRERKEFIFIIDNFIVEDTILIQTLEKILTTTCFHNNKRRIQTVLNMALLKRRTGGVLFGSMTSKEDIMAQERKSSERGEF